LNCVKRSSASWVTRIWPSQAGEAPAPIVRRYRHGFGYCPRHRLMTSEAAPVLVIALASSDPFAPRLVSR